MLIDRTHKPWIACTAVVALLALGLYLFLTGQSPDAATGGSTAGLWYGIIGSALMVYAGLLSAHRRIPRWRFLPARAWLLKGHIWLGLLSLVFILCHSGFHWGGTLERWLWIVFGLTLATGIVGLLLQHIVPRLLSNLGEEVPYDQIPHVLRRLRAEADQIFDEIDVDLPALKALKPALGLKGDGRTFYETQARRFRENGNGRRPSDVEANLAIFGDAPDLAPQRDLLERLRLLILRERDLLKQQKLLRWLHAWLLVHVPLAVALLVLGTAHAVLSTFY